MGLFESLFPSKKDPAIKGYFKTLTAYQPIFYSRSGGLYEIERTRSAVNAFALHCSKLKPNVVGASRTVNGKTLALRMNPWQMTSQFLARTATILEIENTCFLAPIINERGRTVGAFPLLPSMCELVEGMDGTLYLRYQFQNGKRAAVEYSRCGVLVNMQYKDDFFGESNGALNPTLDLINTQNQGITEGIKSAAALRFMAKLAQKLRPEDVAAEQKRFRELNLSAENNGGVLIYDTAYADVKQIESKPFVVDADQMKLINDNVDSYFGTNEKILRNEWDEQTFTAYYESKIEPFALQLSLVMTSMFFSEREIAAGNEITFSANRLQFASTKDKVNIITQLFDRGMLNGDEGREIMQMPPLPDGKGQQYFIRGEYVGTDERLTETGGKTDGTE